jgi:hypothetical protein
MGMASEKLSNSEAAFEFLLKSKQISEEIGDQNLKAKNESDLGYIHLKDGNIKQVTTDPFKNRIENAKLETNVGKRTLGTKFSWREYNRLNIHHFHFLVCSNSNRSQDCTGEMLSKTWVVLGVGKVF